MQIQLNNISKRFKKHWIFKSINHDFIGPNNYGIIGDNGGGKSTLLKTIAGITSPTEGELHYQYSGTNIHLNNLFPFLAIVAPYMDLPNELKLNELFRFQKNFKDYSSDVNESNFFPMIQLEGKEEEIVKNLSSGMKQRLKLGLALLSESKVVLLDEPCSNLDKNGRDLYKELLNRSKNKLIIIASNSNNDELFECETILNINHFKV